MQWFYSELIPWHNYVPIAPNMSDLVDKVLWLSRNDEYARRIGCNGQQLGESLTLESELARSVPVISAAFRHFRDPAAFVLPYGMAREHDRPPPGTPGTNTQGSPGIL